MIEVTEVRPTPGEMRPVFGAWPVVRAWGYVTRGWAATMILLTVGVGWWLATPAVFLWIAVCLAALVYGLLLLALVANRHIDRIGRATPLGRSPSRWVLDEAGVRIISPLGEQSLDWRAIVRVAEEKDRLLFAAMPGRTHVLPTRCLRPDQLAALRGLIVEVRASGRLGAGLGVDEAGPPQAL